MLRFFNKYDRRLTKRYQATNLKPDKYYSILPTVLSLTGDVAGKTILDLGCGSGFFSKPLAQAGAEMVIGLDNSQEQLKLAKEIEAPNLEFKYADVFSEDLPKADVITVPFIANYIHTEDELGEFFGRLNQALHKKGRVVIVMDLPSFPKGKLSWKRMKAIGATKMFTGIFPGFTGPTISNTLWSAEGKELCILHVRYYSQISIQLALQKAGLKDIQWHLPIISQEGLDRYGDAFWADYPECCELAYITAHKGDGP